MKYNKSVFFVFEEEGLKSILVFFFFFFYHFILQCFFPHILVKTAQEYIIFILVSVTREIQNNLGQHHKRVIAL